MCQDNWLPIQGYWLIVLGDNCTDFTVQLKEHNQTQANFVTQTHLFLESIVTWKVAHAVKKYNIFYWTALLEM